MKPADTPNGYAQPDMGDNRQIDARLRIFTFSAYMITATLLTVLPVYFQLIGFSKLQIGLIFALGPSMGIFANLVWGIASDRLQTIKRIIIAAIAGQFIAAFLMFQTHSFAFVFNIMLFYYFFQTPVNGLNDSQILLRTAQTGKSYASFRGIGSLGFAVTSVVFGLLLRQVTAPKIVWLAMSAFTITLTASLFLRESRVRMTRMDFSGIYKVVFSRPLMVFLGLILLIAVTQRINDSFLSLYLIDLGASQTMVGVTWTVVALSEIPVFFLMGRYGARFKELPLLAFAAVVYCFRFLMLSLPLPIGWVIVVQLLHSISFGILLITAFRYMQQLIPDEFRATGQALFNVVFGGVAGLIAGAAGGAIFDSSGGHAVYFAASMLAGAAAIGFITVHFIRERNA